jgi:hypothetical protein
MFSVEYIVLTCSEKGVRLVQTMPVGPCIPVGIQLEKAEVGPTSGPTRRLSHLLRLVQDVFLVVAVRALRPAAHGEGKTHRVDPEFAS